MTDVPRKYKQACKTLVAMDDAAISRITMPDGTVIVVARASKDGHAPSCLSSWVDEHIDDEEPHGDKKPPRPEEPPLEN